MSTLRTQQATGRPAAGAERLRNASFFAVIALLVQYVLGIAYNLFGTAPAPGKPIGVFSGGLIAVHAILGILLVLGAADLLVRAIRSGTRLVVVSSAIALLAVIGAAVNGFLFTRNGASGSSMGMAVSFAVALLCCVVNLWAVRGSGQDR